MAHAYKVPTVPGALMDKPDPKPKARALSGLDQIQAACGIIFISV
jgi:hypothetical protein